MPNPPPKVADFADDLKALYKLGEKLKEGQSIGYDRSGSTESIAPDPLRVLWHQQAVMPYIQKWLETEEEKKAIVDEHNVNVDYWNEMMRGRSIASTIPQTVLGRYTPYSLTPGGVAGLRASKMMPPELSQMQDLYKAPTTLKDQYSFKIDVARQKPNTGGPGGTKTLVDLYLTDVNGKQVKVGTDKTYASVSDVSGVTDPKTFQTFKNMFQKILHRYTVKGDVSNPGKIFDYDGTKKPYPTEPLTLTYGSQTKPIDLPSDIWKSNHEFIRNMLVSIPLDALANYASDFYNTHLAPKLREIPKDSAWNALHGWYHNHLSQMLKGNPDETIYRDFTNAVSEMQNAIRMVLTGIYKQNTAHPLFKTFNQKAADTYRSFGNLQQFYTNPEHLAEDAFVAAWSLKALEALGVFNPQSQQQNKPKTTP